MVFLDHARPLTRPLVCLPLSRQPNHPPARSPDRPSILSAFSSTHISSRRFPVRVRPVRFRTNVKSSILEPSVHRTCDKLSIPALSTTRLASSVISVTEKLDHIGSGH